jgi:MYXO-CTERM domain-containing protein
MRIAQLASAFAAATTILLASSVASATSNFPGAIRTKLALTYDPQCALCHTNGITGRGTVTTPFGKAMLARGLVASDETALNTALDKMVADKVDSDLDGTTDIDELKAGTDPNGNSISVAYGCNASGSTDASAVVLGLAVGGLLLASRRRRRAA